MSEIKNKSQYKSVFKATALFGGVQIWQILIGIVRSKLTALILGPTGMGISGLYTSSTELVRSFTNLGLSASGVKYIAEANAGSDHHGFSRIVSIFKKLMWFTGLLGMLGVILFSPLLSKSAFGNYSYTVPFIFLSVILLSQQLSSGYLSLLQGVRHLKPLAKASFIGSILSLITTIPLYYLFGIKGIVPALIIGSFTSLLLNWYFSRDIEVKKVKVTLKETIAEGKGMIGMGLAMAFSGLLATVVAYIVRVFVANKGGTSEVGLYAAGMTIITTYVGMIFTAMGTDYFPRLSSFNHDNAKCKELVNQQSEIALLILGPVLEFFVLLAPFVIIILYSKEFLPTVLYMQWAALGMFFKAVSWAISFLFWAKGDTKQFIINEIIANIVTLVTSVTGYWLWGLKGLGIAFVGSYVIYLLLVWLVSKRNYNFSFSSSLPIILVIHLSLTSIIFLTLYRVNGLWKYPITVLLGIIGLVYSIYELNKRLDIREFINRKIRKNDG